MEFLFEIFEFSIIIFGISIYFKNFNTSKENFQFSVLLNEQTMELANSF